MKTIVLTALLTALWAVSPASAQPRPPRPPGPPGGPPGGPPLAGPVLAMVAKKVGLSAAQVQKIKKLTYATRRRAIGIHSKLALARLNLRETMEADKVPSEAKVSALVDRVGRLETQMKKNHVLMLLRLRKTVTLTQWRKMELLHAKRKMKRMKRMKGFR